MIDRAIAEIAAKQLGSITRAQLISLGVDDSAIRRRIAAGRLHRILYGVYAVGHAPVLPLELASAAVLAGGPGAALGHGSAMAHWGFWERWERPLEVIVVGDRRPTGLRAHRSHTHSWRDLTNHRGIRVTTPARTLLDVAPRLTDRQLKRTVNSALGAKWLKEGHLVELLERCGHMKSGGRIAALLGLSGTPTRSCFEDTFPEFCALFDLPDPVMGAMVCGYTVDALFAAERVIVELDSWEFHQSKIAFEDDRERDANTLASGFVTVRPTYERLYERAAKEAARLHTILELRRAQAA